MFEFVERIKVRLGNSNFMILCFEQFLFSVLYGIVFRSWVVFGVIFFSSFWLLNRPRRTVNMTYAMSFLWGFIGFSIGHSISWGWATALGMAFFMLGIVAHLTGLKKLVGDTVALVISNSAEWRRNGYEGEQNLN